MCKFIDGRTCQRRLQARHERSRSGELDDQPELVAQQTVAKPFKYGRHRVDTGPVEARRLEQRSECT